MLTGTIIVPIIVSIAVFSLIAGLHDVPQHRTRAEEAHRG